jgi:hypothetical protein
MTGDLQSEVAIPSLIDQLAGRRPPNRQSAEDEGPGSEAQRLGTLLAFHADQLDALDLSESVF